MRPLSAPVAGLDGALPRSELRLTRPVFRTTRWDALLLGASAALALTLVTAVLLVSAAGPLWSLVVTPLLALGFCWHANAVAHNHLHNPIFRSRALNRAFDLWMSALTGVPQTLWKRRHLWHHAGEPAAHRRSHLDRRTREELALIAGVWGLGAALAPQLFALVYLPAYLLGLALGRLQGAMEHLGQTPQARAGGISSYGRLHNWLWFNDGYHVEHHRHPGRHWRAHPSQRRLAARDAISPWSPLLRWLTPLGVALNRACGRALVGLERLALRSGLLQRWLVRVHRRAAERLLPTLGQTPEHVCLVGGGLFPRTLLALAPLFPRSRFTVIDGSAASVQTACSYLERHAPALLARTRFEQRLFAGDADPVACAAQLVVTPLGFVGGREALYAGAARARRCTWVHDWLWRRAGQRSTSVSWLLCKRLNAVLPADAPAQGEA